MSRSFWVWTEGCAAAVGVVGGVGSEGQARSLVGRECLSDAASAFMRVGWLVVAVVLVLACGPAVGLSNAREPSPSSADRSLPAANVGLRPVGLGAGVGSRGGVVQVLVLQRRLAVLGFAPGPLDGRYGPRTEQAVMRLQAAHGLPVDGVAGPRTVAALAAPAVGLYPGVGLQSGASGAVRVLQARLAAAGFAPGPLDGRYGPRTEQAVTRFQAARGVRADGVADPATLARLGDAQAAPQHPASHPTHPATSPARGPATSPGSVSPAATQQPAAPAASRVAKPSSSHGGSTLAWTALAALAAVALIGLLAIVAWRWTRGRAALASGASREPRATDRDQAASHNGSHHPAPATGHGAHTIITPTAHHAEADPAHAEATAHSDAEGAFNLGVLLERQGDTVGAMAAYGRADEYGHAPAACNLGVLLEEREQTTNALAAYRRAAQRGDANGAFNLGVLLEGQGDIAGALSAYRRADECGHGPAACNLGVLLEAQADTAGALAAYGRAAQRGDANGAFNLGALLEEHGEPAAALATHDHTTNHQPPEHTPELAAATTTHANHA